MNFEEEFDKLWEDYPEHRKFFVEAILLASGYSIVPKTSRSIEFMKRWNADNDR